MTDVWSATIWTEARQIGGLLGWPSCPGDEAPPARFYAALRHDRKDVDAAMFLGQALPRYEAVCWATETVARFAEDPDPATMALVRRWIDDPSDANRRSAHAIVADAAAPGPAEHCALAVFLSGGSIAREADPPLTPPRDMAGRFAAAAVLLATVHRPDAADALAAALDRGAALAGSCEEEIG